jgi:hypothetical protein
MLFIEAPPFTRLVLRYLDDDEYRRLQMALVAKPDAGSVIPGTGGFRKLRWLDPRRSRGTRGGLRVIYFHFVDVAEIWLVTLYAKGEVEDLSPDERRRLKWLVDLEISRRRRRTRDRGDRR